ncbi:MAG: hemolysin family protein [Oscillospiraceae bacterium]|nr:hemolysin family protein [Oscillospiraceae bacterium]
MKTALLILLLVFLVAASAFFSSSEIIYATANKIRLQKRAEGGSKRAALAVRISDDYPNFLSTVLVGNNLVNIAFSSAVAVLGLMLWGMSEGVASLAATAILLVLGEIIPKLIGTYRADELIVPYARPIRLCRIIFFPVVFVVTKLVGALSIIWTPKDPEPEVTDDELVTILESIEDEGVFTEKEGELIRSAIEFSDLTAQDIFIPRVDMYAWDADDDIDELLKNDDYLSFSRLPVYRESIDNIIGILSTKKLIKTILTSGKEGFDIGSVLTPAVFVHKTRNISSILLEFKTRRSQMAIVVDEFGGTMGILTLEDILEEIFGDIFDESDEVEKDIEAVGDDTYLVDATVGIEEFFGSIGYTPSEDFDSEYTTMGGWAVEMLDKFPEAGDTFTYDVFEVTVTKASGMRVEQLKIKVEKTPEDTDE